MSLGVAYRPLGTELVFSCDNCNAPITAYGTASYVFLLAVPTGYGPVWLACGKACRKALEHRHHAEGSRKLEDWARCLVPEILMKQA